MRRSILALFVEPQPPPSTRPASIRLTGKLEVNYDKHHLLPGVEPETPGRERALINEPSGRWGLQICKDMDFPKLSREYAGDGANLLLVPCVGFWAGRLGACAHGDFARC